jgi:hypothetical protein
MLSAAAATGSGRIQRRPKLTLNKTNRTPRRPIEWNNPRTRLRTKTNPATRPIECQCGKRSASLVKRRRRPVILDKWPSPARISSQRHQLNARSCLWPRCLPGAACQVRAPISDWSLRTSVHCLTKSGDAASFCNHHATESM